MVRSLALALLLLAVFTARAHAGETPTPASSDAATATPTPAETPAPSTSTPLAEVTPPAQTAPFTIASQLIVDHNGNGQADRGEEQGFTPTLVQLVSWSRLPDSPADPRFPGAVVNIYTDPDGSFSFTNVPPGTYTVWVWWIGGFVHGATERLPDLFRAILSVTDGGGLTSPEQIPATWPESFGEEPVNVGGDHNTIGFVPQPLLLKPKEQFVVPYPVSSNTLIHASGQIDVRAHFAALEDQRPGVQLPDAGAGEAWDASWLPAVVIALAVAALAAFRLAPALRRRR